LLFVGWALFKKYDLLARFKVPSQVLVNFLTTVEKGYRDNPYHNSTHAADVVQTVHFFMSRSGQFGGQTTQIEVMAALVASAIHDYDHPVCWLQDAALIQSIRVHRADVSRLHRACLLRAAPICFTSMLDTRSRSCITIDPCWRIITVQPPSQPCLLQRPTSLRACKIKSMKHIT